MVFDDAWGSLIYENDKSSLQTEQTAIIYVPIAYICSKLNFIRRLRVSKILFTWLGVVSFVRIKEPSTYAYWKELKITYE